VGATGHDRQPPALADVFDRGVRSVGEGSGRVPLARVGHVDEVVTHAIERCPVGFVGSDVEATIDLTRVH